eukprot:TRINITY_DN6137_c0_g1_i2.p1 TRINITY_DN6137_c0_g1~~TRINITY_DN6137_c0_g1_i2.p1  ORF type:complete len:609 (+),score=105.85 TRINITY_DN6137_c0_g1_i2:267-2093(+)
MNEKASLLDDKAYQQTGFFAKLFRTQSIALRDRSLAKVLTVVDLVAYGIASTVGSGIYVSTGIAARGGDGQIGAGPAVALSYLGAGLASLFSALCYAEFAARIPISGSAYTFSYVSLGEIVAWIIAWCLTLEYAISASAVAQGWAGNFCNLAFPNDGCPLWLNGWSVSSGSSSGDEVISTSLLSIIIIAACTLILIVGAKESSTFNVCMTVWNIVVILFIIILGSFHINPENWKPVVPNDPSRTSFLPNGMKGVFMGAGTVFFSYIGFDSVTTLAAEVKNPKRDMPLGIIGTLGVATLLYIAASLVLTGMVPYTELDLTAPLATAFGQINPPVGWARTLVAVGSLTTLSATTLTCLMGQPRIFYQMAKDGLLLPAFLKLSKNKVPVVSTIITGVLASILAALFNLNLLSDMISIGTLLAFSMVCSGMLFVRYKPETPEAVQWGRTPGVENIARFVGKNLWWFIVGWWLFSIGFGLMERQNTLSEDNEIVVSGAYFAIPAAFGVVIALLLCTLKPQNLPENFTCPFVPITPLIGIFVNTFLILQKTRKGLIYFSIWFALGLVVYFSYGFWHSRLNNPNAAPIDEFDDDNDDLLTDEEEEVAKRLVMPVN